MILNEREMQMAKELARELVRVEKEKQRKQFEESLNVFKNTVIKIWATIKKFFKEFWQNAFKYLQDEKVEKRNQITYREPLKIEVPPMPDIRAPKLYNARSNI